MINISIRSDPHHFWKVHFDSTFDIIKKEAQMADYVDRRRVVHNSTLGGIYGLAFIGALVYYIQHAATFGAGVLGVLKAIVWPALLVYHLLGYLKM